jgi:chromosome segregation ATPase
MRTVCYHCGNYADGADHPNSPRAEIARLQEQVETLTRKNERLENTLKLHSGDVMSLNNEVELFRSHWNDAEARAEAAEAERDRLRADRERLIFHVAQLRHAYTKLPRQLADGLISPAIAAFEDHIAAL